MPGRCAVDVGQRHGALAAVVGADVDLPATPARLTTSHSVISSAIAAGISGTPPPSARRRPVRPAAVGAGVASAGVDQVGGRHRGQRLVPVVRHRQRTEQVDASGAGTNRIRHGAGAERQAPADNIEDFCGKPHGQSPNPSALRRTQKQLCVTMLAAATLTRPTPQAFLTQRPCSSGCQ